jgi:diguanylate cyclase (GGDEF)-like protein
MRRRIPRGAREPAAKPAEGADIGMSDQPLLIALVAVQFFVHALGWTMTAHLTRRWRDAEGQFAVFWLLLAAGLMLYVPAWPSGSLPRNLANLLIVAAMAAQHRGMMLFWHQRPNDRGYLTLLVCAVLAIVLSLALEYGHGLRVATVCVGGSVMLLATARLIWQRGRTEAPLFAKLVAGCYTWMALVLLARAVQALNVEPATKISIDAPGHSNVPLAILVMFVGGLINLAHIRLVLGRILQRLTAQAQTDMLTGAANRRGLMRQLAEIHQRAQHGGHGYVVLMVDIDHFKSINDAHGHAQGDQVLKRVAQSLRDGLRVGDVVARWGGEEFCVLLPRIRLAEAHALAERVAVQIAATGLPRVTVSIGVAEAQARAEDAESVVRRADAALYEAKEAGRNRVVMANDIAAA